MRSTLWIIWDATGPLSFGCRLPYTLLTAHGRPCSPPQVARLAVTVILTSLELQKGSLPADPERALRSAFLEAEEALSKDT